MARIAALTLATTALLAAPAGAAAAGNADVAALQVALRAAGLYSGTIDGVEGAGTQRAVRTFQSRKGLAPDGVAGTSTRAALGRRGGPRLGSRVLQSGSSGWDVASLQFLLA